MYISFLHFGQNKGKFTRTVSSQTFVRVLAEQFGHLIQRVSLRILSILHLTTAALRSTSGFMLSNQRFILKLTI